MKQKINETETRRPEMPDRIFQRKREDRQRPVNTRVIKVPPIRLKQQLKWSDVPDVLIAGNNWNVIKYEGIRKRVHITHDDEHCANDHCTCRRNVTIGQVHLSAPKVRRKDRSSIEACNPARCSN